MAQQTLNNGISASVFRQILNENFSDLYNNTPTKNHASTTTDFGVATTNVFGHIKVTTGNGLNLNNGVLSLAAATTNDAVVGTATTMVMTPARVKDAINGYGVVSDGNTIIKIGDTECQVLWITQIKAYLQ